MAHEQTIPSTRTTRTRSRTPIRRRSAASTGQEARPAGGQSNLVSTYVASAPEDPAIAQANDLREMARKELMERMREGQFGRRLPGPPTLKERIEEEKNKVGKAKNLDELKAAEKRLKIMELIFS